MKRIGKYLCIFVSIASTFGCKESFIPQLKESNDKLLVVEGMITLGAERTYIRLSRTVPVTQVKGRTPELGAQVSIEASDGQAYTLVEKPLGNYESAILNLNASKKYRLKIVSRGAQYITDYLEAKISPTIDNITWEVKPNGLQLYVDTHDDANASKYYRWDFDDTWIFYANYNSALIWDGSGLKTRDRNTSNIYKCWGEGVSNSIFLASTAKLSKDVVNKQPLALIMANSEKLTEKYSVLVKQYVLTKEAFDFWENLRKNTESLGAIFDAQPSQLTGNIRNVKVPNEPVLGFVSVGSVQRKRIFIEKAALPNWKVKATFDCNPPDTLALNQVNLFSDPNYIPLEEIFNGFGVLTNYTGTQRKCGDCTFRGTNRKPAFWQ